MRRLSAKLLRVVLWTSGLAVLLSALIAFVLHLTQTERWIFSQIQQAAENSGLILAADGFRYNLLRGSLELDGVTLRAKAKPPFLTVRHASLSWKYVDLRNEFSAIERVQVDGANVHLYRGADGKLNVPEADGAGTR